MSIDTFKLLFHFDYAYTLLYDLGASSGKIWLLSRLCNIEGIAINVLCCTIVEIV